MTRINLANPTPEDIAAGLGEKQCKALIEVRADKAKGPNQIPLDRPIPGWREPLIIRRGSEVILTGMGAKVRKVLLASGMETRSAIDPKGRGPKGNAHEQ